MHTYVKYSPTPPFVMLSGFLFIPAAFGYAVVTGKMKKSVALWIMVLANLPWLFFFPLTFGIDLGVYWLGKIITQSIVEKDTLDINNPPHRRSSDHYVERNDDNDQYV